jgi:hypothetical protein
LSKLRIYTICINARGIKKEPKKDTDILATHIFGFLQKISIAKKTNAIIHAESDTSFTEISFKKHKSKKNNVIIIREIKI